MNRKQYDADNLPTQIVIGRQTETGVMSIYFDCTGWLTWWPNLTLSIWVTPPGGSSAYLATTHMEDKLLVWDVDNADTAMAGQGTMEIVGTASGQRKLSAVTATKILASTTTKVTNPPEKGQSFLDQMAEATAKAEDATAAAKAAAGNADVAAALAADITETATAAEAGRAQAESLRAANEQNRVDAEGLRADAETGRAQAESERATAEAQRESAEQERATAEQARVSAEQQRAETFAGYQGEIGSLKDDLAEIGTVIYSENLFDVSEVINNKSLNPNGELVDNETYSASPFIRVTENQISLTALLFGAIRNMTGCLSCYDSSKTFIENIYPSYNATGDTIISIGSNVAYVRFACETQYIEKAMLCYSKPSEYIPYSKKTVLNDSASLTLEMEKEVTDMVSSTDEKANLSITQINKIYDETSNAFNDIDVSLELSEKTDPPTPYGTNWSDENYKVVISQNIPIQYGDAVEAVSMAHKNNIPKLAVFDADGNLLYTEQTSYNNNDTVVETYTISNIKATYVVLQGFTGKSVDVSTLNWKLKVKAKTNVVQSMIDSALENITSQNILNGKKWVACGDSFTEGDFTGYVDANGNTGKQSDAYDSEMNMWKTYPWWIAKRNNMNIINEAKCGSDFTNIDGASNPFSVSRYLNVPTDADYITLMFGLNETGLTDEQIGTNTDSDNTTLWGAYNVVFEYFITNMPYAKIGVIIADAWMPEKYANAVKDICKYWGIPVLDLKYDDSIPMGMGGRPNVSQKAKTLRNNAFYVTSENFHPNLKAHEYRSTFIENFLRSL